VPLRHRNRPATAIPGAAASHFVRAYSHFVQETAKTVEIPGP
jgi:hypothetical protein